MPVTLLLTTITMLAFASNSLLTRAALADGAIDAISFTTIRFAAGAVTLVALTLWQSGRRERSRLLVALPGNWTSAVCLFVYGMGFSLAYLRLGAATGALILFASVQAGMIAWGVRCGHHPNRTEAVGLVIAFVAFVVLMLPGLHAPDLWGSLLMMSAGLAWAAYSLRGRGSADPLGETAGNFVRMSLACLPVALLKYNSLHAGGDGIVLAVICGSVTSGLGYSIWYHAMRGLKPLQAASVQLTVPLIAAVGGMLLLSEAPTLRLVVAGGSILFGVSLTILSKGSPAAPTRLAENLSGRSTSGPRAS
jgi:drug/metabolite transporter (DMT)-like permease